MYANGMTKGPKTAVDVGKTGHAMAIFMLLLAMICNCYANSPEIDFTVCPSSCDCKWNSGRKEGNCLDKALTQVPELNSMIQVVVLDQNRIEKLPEDVFVKANLNNVQKLTIRYNLIRTIHKDAFRGLKILFFLDLSGNKIHELHPKMFLHLDKLRNFYANKNEIKRLDDYTFYNNTHLKTVEINDCDISRIGLKAFSTLENLNVIQLNYNKLTHVKLHAFQSLPALTSLELMGNLWHCDCHLREFKIWLLSKNLLSEPTVCHSPEYLRNQKFREIADEKFACKPEIIYPKNTNIGVREDSVTLTCKVTGDPLPVVQWVYHSRTVNNEMVDAANPERKFAVRENHLSQNVASLNLTVTKLKVAERVEFSCGATNEGGLAERNISVEYKPESSILDIVEYDAKDILFLIACVVASSLLCAAILLFFWRGSCCRKRSFNFPFRKKNSNSAGQNGEVTHRVLEQPEHQKTLLTAVNPVQKPPRKYDPMQADDASGTEMTEMNKRLLDDMSVTGGATSIADSGADDHASTDSEGRASSRHSQNQLLLHDKLKRYAMDRLMHQPDLLPFPPSKAKFSPSNSCTSNDLLLKSSFQPTGNMTNIYGMLPYGRAHSPFMPSIISHRQGYVTIPRRPRVPSWSSTPTPTLMDDTFGKCDPLYDNFGPRVTMDGSSMASLNKCSDPSPNNSRFRPVPAALHSQTLPRKSKLNRIYAPIKESGVGIPQFHSTPRSENPAYIKPMPLDPMYEDLSPPSPARENPKVVNRSLPETGVLKKPQMPSISTIKEDAPKMNIAANKPKVAPKPPPKPSKNDTIVFQDEGEDGTEV